MSRRNAVFVIYTFPPMGGPGVQRAVKFGKFLPRFGWNVTFVTVKDVVYHTYDPSLADAIASDTRVIRTGSADPLRLAHLLRELRGKPAPGAAPPKQAADSAAKARVLKLYRTLQRWLFVVDPQLLWVPFAVEGGLRAVRESHASVVVAMPQPSSTAVAGYLISLLSGRPLVLDMRDPWTQDPYLRMPTPLHRKANEWLERQTYLHASEIAVISDSMRQAILRRYPQLADRVSVITNGFDSEDFAAAAPVAKDDRFEIVYTGSLYGHHAPVFRRFCAGLRMLLERRPALRVRLRLVGRIEREIDEVLTGEKVREVTEVTGYVPHGVAVGYTKSADLLLLIIKSDLDQARDVITIPGKFFEYLASRRPVLYLGPHCEASAILERTGQGKVIAIEPADIAREIESAIDRPPAQGIDQAAIDSYERRNQARHMADLLTRACENAGDAAK